MTAGEAVTAGMRALATSMAETETLALQDAPDGVHRNRVVVRRLRSVLTTYRDLFDAVTIDPLLVLLHEWGTQLGVVRDIEVRAKLAEALIDEVLESEDTALRRRLVDDERAEYSLAHARLVALHGGPRSEQRRALLAQLVREAPSTASTAASSEKLRAVLVRQAHRVLKRAKRIDGSEAGYHAVRKAARRLRYAVDAVTDDPPAPFGAKAAALADAGKRLHNVLGDHRDALLLADRIERTSVLAARAGEPVEGYLRMAGAARGSSEHHLAKLDKALRRMRRAAKAFR